MTAQPVHDFLLSTLERGDVNNTKRRREDKIRTKASELDDELRHQIAKVEQAIETSSGYQREHYRALLKRLQQVLEMEPDI